MSPTFKCMGFHREAVRGPTWRSVDRLDSQNEKLRDTREGSRYQLSVALCGQLILRIDYTFHSGLRRCSGHREFRVLLLDGSYGK